MSSCFLQEAFANISLCQYTIESIIISGKIFNLLYYIFNKCIKKGQSAVSLFDSMQVSENPCTIYA